MAALTAVVVRIVLVLSLLGAAAVHLIEWDDWARAESVVGPLFLVNTGAGIVIAAGVLGWRRHWLPPLTAVAFGVATLGAYLVSLTVGLFGVQQQLTTDAELWGIGTDLGCILGGLALLAVLGRQRLASASSGTAAGAAGTARDR